MPPDLDLDLDLVEKEAWPEERREEEERRQQKQEEEWRRKEEEKEQRRRRSQTVMQKKQDDQREEGRRSRSLPSYGARSWDTFQPEEQMEVEESGGRMRERRSETKSRRREAGREEERDIRAACHAKHSGSSSAAQRAAFSFLMPMDDDEPLSDSESAASFSEVSLSAASIASAGWREDFDWRRVESPWRHGNAPGRWLKPSQQRLTKVLIGSRLGGEELAGGLSL